MTLWLLEEDTAAEFRAFCERVQPTAQDRERFQAWERAEAAEESRLLTVAGGVAEILVAGMLTESPNFWAILFGGGGTTYREIAKALAEAAQDSRVSRVDLRINSPGGTVDGLSTVLRALKGYGKPTRAVASKATSAAFAIAAATGEIIAEDEWSSFGSVGVAASFYVADYIVDLASTAAPEKRPDLTTDEGKAMVRKRLDDIHTLFVSGLAEGRKTTPERVNAEYGRGGVLLAKDALQRGMIDGIAGTSPGYRNAAASADRGAQTEMVKMDPEKLRAEHPAVYEAVVKIGEKKERSRCTAHVKMAKSTGAVDFALSAIAEGKSIQDDEVQAEYLSARANRADTDARQRESDTAGEATKGASKPAANDRDLGDLVADELLGKEE